VTTLIEGRCRCGAGILARLGVNPRCDGCGRIYTPPSCPRCRTPLTAADLLNTIHARAPEAKDDSLVLIGVPACQRCHEVTRPTGA